MPSRNDTARDDDKDGFPEFPTKDVAYCIINFSLVCAKERVSRFVESIRELNEIYLMGREMKLVKTRVISGRRSSNDSSIERSVDNFFDTFALRITLPRWNGKREKNQIDVMLDETALSEGLWIQKYFLLSDQFLLEGEIIKKRIDISEQRDEMMIPETIVLLNLSQRVN